MSHSTNGIHLVDVDGFDVPTGEKNLPPHDPTDPANWPAWTDNWFWECEPDERAALEALALEAETDRHDAPPLSQVSPTELSMMASGLAIG
jgi:hypothetical protein